MKYTLEELLTTYRPIIINLANHYTNIDFGLEFDDLYQSACLYIIERYPTYDMNKSAASTFVFNMAYYGILDYIQKNSKIMKVAEKKFFLANKLSNQNVSFYQMHGRIMSMQEKIAWLMKEEINIDKPLEVLKELEKINFYQNRKQVYSIESELEKDNGEDNFLVINVPISDIDVENLAISKVDLETFINSLTYLTSKELNSFLSILGLIDGIPKTYAQYAKSQSVTKQTIYRNYNRALKKIKIKNQKNNLI